MWAHSLPLIEGLCDYKGGIYKCTSAKVSDNPESQFFMNNCDTLNLTILIGNRYKNAWASSQETFRCHSLSSKMLAFCMAFAHLFVLTSDQSKIILYQIVKESGLKSKFIAVLPCICRSLEIFHNTKVI